MAVADIDVGRGNARPGFPQLGGGFRRILREPLLHFLLLGALIYWAGTVHLGAQDQYRIVIDDARIARLVQTYEQQFGGEPSPAMRRTLIDNYVNEEILYREGIAMGLDRDDEVIRRRVVQKMQFVGQSLPANAVPTDAVLRDYYDAHKESYTSPSRISFTQIYFSPDRGGDAAARARALTTLATLTDKIQRAPQLGDPYPDLYDYSSISPQDARRLFGRTPIVTALFALHPNNWAGPFRSGFGWHLVRLTALEPERTQSYAEAREQVRADYLADAQLRSDEAAFAAMKARYTVVRSDAAP